MEAGGGKSFFVHSAELFGGGNFTGDTRMHPPKCLYISKIDQVWVCLGEVSVGFIYVEMVVFFAVGGEVLYSCSVFSFFWRAKLVTMQYHVCFLELCVIHNDILDTYLCLGFNSMFFCCNSTFVFCGEDEIHIPF